jgi:hypothetical protein
MGAADQATARRAYRLFIQNPSHNSLRFKKLAAHRDLWSVRVSISIRAVGHRDGDTIIWVWIGSHGNFDSIFGWVQGQTDEQVENGLIARAQRKVIAAPMLPENGTGTHFICPTMLLAGRIFTRRPIPKVRHSPRPIRCPPSFRPSGSRCGGHGSSRRYCGRCRPRRTGHHRIRLSTGCSIACTGRWLPSLGESRAAHADPCDRTIPIRPPQPASHAHRHADPAPRARASGWRLDANG